MVRLLFIYLLLFAQTGFAFVEQISESIPKERLLIGRELTLPYAQDASFYMLVPQVVVIVENEEEIKACLQAAHTDQVPVTFRAGGTSLSGQSITDSVLIVLSPESWKDAEISSDGSLIRLQPGLTGEEVNQMLAPYQKRLGPDPASLKWAKVGGMASTNASGICCRREQDSYHTLVDMRVILGDGTVLDVTQTKLLQGIQQLAAEVKNNPTLVEKIRQAYRTKNTMGYSLNALLDFEDPLEMIKHLMIGAEGTLGFISEITYRTVPHYSYSASAFVMFDDVDTLCEAIQFLSKCPVSAVEFMDGNTLKAAGISEKSCALLIETRAHSQQELAENIALINLPFTTNKEQCNAYWAVRKKLLIYAARACKPGETVFIEDVAVSMDQLAGAITDIQQILTAHGYMDTFTWGHGLEGNIHFVFSQPLEKAEDLARYKNLMETIASVIVTKYQGSLKGEHGTGRNMAPFVAMQWGEESYSIMHQIKMLFDPMHLLNRGVILNKDPLIYLKDLKKIAPTEKYDYSWLK